MRIIIPTLLILTLTGCWFSPNFEGEASSSVTTEEMCRDICDKQVTTKASGQVVKDDSFWSRVIISWLPWSFYFAYYGVGLIIGVLVFRDASRRKTLAFNIKPFWWGAIVFIEPPLGVLCYWVIHYSTFSIIRNEEQQ